MKLFLAILVGCALFLSRPASSEYTGYNIGSTNCVGGDDFILDCLRHFFDPNDDDILTPAEIDAGLPALNDTQTAHLVDGVTSAEFLTYCDIDEDGNLTMDDWNHVNRTVNTPCLNDQLQKEVFCWVCFKNGFVPPS